MSTVGDNRAAGESKAVETWLEVLGAVEAEPTRRGGRVVECGGLENRWSRKRPGGSNPSPSASFIGR